MQSLHVKTVSEGADSAVKPPNCFAAFTSWSLDYSSVLPLLQSPLCCSHPSALSDDDFLLPLLPMLPKVGKK